jgi:hypothetical protein
VLDAKRHPAAACSAAAPSVNCSTGSKEDRRGQPSMQSFKLVRLCTDYGTCMHVPVQCEA